ISSLQRKLKVGYNRAARMIESMEMAGVVSPADHTNQREVIAPPPVRDLMTSMKTLLRSSITALCLAMLPLAVSADDQSQAAERLNQLLSRAHTLTGGFS